MSKEMEPIRSRRELRAQLAQSEAAKEQAALPSPAMPKTGDTTVSAAVAEQAAGATAVPARTSAPPRGDTTQQLERQSQVRARDRAALRAYKELVDPAVLNPLPSRRALRQAQLDADRAPITAVNPVASQSAAQPQATAQPRATGQPQVTADPQAPAPATAPAVAPRIHGTQPVPGTPTRTRVGRRAAAKTVDDSHTATQRPATPSGSGDNGETKPPSGRIPAPHLAAPAAVAGEALTSDQETPQASSPGAVSVQHGSYPPLPGLVPGGSYYPVSAGPPATTAPLSAVSKSAVSGSTTTPPMTASVPTVAPTAEELSALADQLAESERAAVLNQRAQTREKLAQESAKSRRPASDPTATDNLAMVTPLEFVDVPGSSRPVMRRPNTKHVPIVTHSTPHQSVGTRKPLPRPERKTPPPKASSVPTPRADRFDAAVAARTANRRGPGNRLLAGGRSSTLRRAEAMATGARPTKAPAVERPSAVPAVDESAAEVAASVHRSQMPPMPADFAHGLEPLDAMTAGLGRTRRNRLLQWGSLVAGGAAFVVGVILLITILTR